MKLRDYEARAVRVLPGLLNVHRRVVAVAPTGSGKTVIAAALIRKMTEARVLWLAHRIELLNQACEQLEAAGVPRKDIGLMSGSKTTNANARLLVAGVGMFRHRMIPNVDMFVVDEAHHVAATSYREILEVKKDPCLLGLTATPWRLDGEPLGDVFKHMHVMAEPVDLIAEGFIRKAKVYSCLDKAGARALTKGLTTSGGDWSRNKLEKVMRKAKLMGDVVSEWKRLAEGLATLVFATTVAHGEDIRKRFLAARISCEIVSWETHAKQRTATLNRLRVGETLVVVNVAVFTEGLDCPPVKCVIVARPTKSLTLWRQMLGRASRPHGDAKPVALDHAGNVWRLGLAEAEVPWSLDGRVRLVGNAPVKKCIACEEMIPISAKNCPECGAEQPTDDGQLEERNAELRRVKEREAAIAEARKRVEKIAKEKGAPKAWSEKVLQEMFAL